MATSTPSTVPVTSQNDIGLGSVVVLNQYQEDPSNTKAQDVDGKTDAYVSSSKTEVKDEPADEQVARPKLVYNSFGAFSRSLVSRLRSVFTLRFTLSLLAGQVISWCITSTNLLTTKLVKRNFAIPTTQTSFLYFALFVVYTPYTIYRYGVKGWFTLLYKDGWKYALLGACDMEGNFLVVKAYQYTNLLSCMLLDAWAIPVCMFFTFVFMKTRFRWAQIIGIFVCIVGLGLLVASDQITDKDYKALNMALGDGYMIVGATLYGFTNALEEFLVRKRPLYEVVGQLGMWGMIWNAVQCSILERHLWFETTWDGANIGFLFLYTFSLFILYTLAPLLYRSSSSVYYNLSLLTSDFYGLLIGLSLYSYHPYWLYFVAFVVVIVGLIIYFWTSTPAEQGQLDVTRPDYVNQVFSPEGARVAGFAPKGDLRNDQV
ncbi:Predicted membrane protein [Phaffia rhodozyma]|uniref:Predicted membrane protein n=1 Tax=Phaffia rhodozyma TaxID=264483 RepID=A0A0F7SQG2_PHARH|nr:Predicted membrane protein [Phaffia rhodozyma]